MFKGKPGFKGKNQYDPVGGKIMSKFLMTIEMWHRSDCATHNLPAYPRGKCDCGLVKVTKRQMKQAAANAGHRFVMSPHGLQLVRDFDLCAGMTK